MRKGEKVESSSYRRTGRTAWGMLQMTFQECLQQHIQLHPLLEAQDIIKFCFQAAFGAEHILMDLKAAEKYFFNEFTNTKEADILLYEELNERYCRVNIAAWKKKGLDPEVLFQYFIQEAGQNNTASDEDMLKLLYTVSDIMKGMNCSVAEKSWNEAMTQYLQSGIHPVHHSDRYRQNYSPAYRVIDIAALNQ